MDKDYFIDAQRYQALRARIGDTAIEKLMAGEAAVVPLRYAEIDKGHYELVRLLYLRNSGKAKYAEWDLQGKRIDRPAEEMQE